MLFNESLDNFRDTDFHFITPIIFNAGQKLIVKENLPEQAGVGPGQELHRLGAGLRPERERPEDEAQHERIGGRWAVSFASRLPASRSRSSWPRPGRRSRATSA